VSETLTRDQDRHAEHAPLTECLGWPARRALMRLETENED